MKFFPRRMKRLSHRFSSRKQVYSQNYRRARRKAIFLRPRVAAWLFFDGVKAQVRPEKAMHSYWCNMSARPACSLPDSFRRPVKYSFGGPRWVIKGTEFREFQGLDKLQRNDFPLS